MVQTLVSKHSEGSRSSHTLSSPQTHFSLFPNFTWKTWAHSIYERQCTEADMKNRKDSCQEIVLHTQLLTKKTGNQEYDKYWFLHSLIRPSDTTLDIIVCSLKSITSLQLFIKGRGRKAQITRTKQYHRLI